MRTKHIYQSETVNALYNGFLLNMTFYYNCTTFFISYWICLSETNYNHTYHDTEFPLPFHFNGYSFARITEVIVGSRDRCIFSGHKKTIRFKFIGIQFLHGGESCLQCLLPNASSTPAEGTYSLVNGTQHL